MDGHKMLNTTNLPMKVTFIGDKDFDLKIVFILLSKSPYAFLRLKSHYK